MIKNITIPIPKKFNFDRTIRLIQRGVDDPINQIHNNKLIRCYWFKDKIALLEVKNRNGTDIVEVALLKGDASKENMATAITNTLGLDDPLLEKHCIKIPHKQKLKKYWGVTAIGYTCYFEALVQIILGQQVSVAVANNIRSRFTRAFGESITYNRKIFYAFPKAESIANQLIKILRNLGMSETKSKGIIALAIELVTNDLADNIHQ